ncbi:phage tail protein [Arsenophonus nasoniae]|uniref:phage tail-collar fiber domain-containing protein n=3 Tax=Arsenophonus nasoniae TaxID=638 RepID=UPI0038790057
MASVITTAFEHWKAEEAVSGKPVLLDEFVFANIPNLDPNKRIERNETLPPTHQIVHRQVVSKAGLASENAVAYSVTLGAEVGDFDFNWIGLLNKASGTVAMITHAPPQKKLKTQNGQQGNVLIRSFLLEFNGAAEETQIKTRAETWQIDFTARLAGIDEMQRLINIDSYGEAAFFDEGFEVIRNGEQFIVKEGLGYVGGLRGQLEKKPILNELRNTKIYADFSYQGNIISQWRTVINITAAPDLNNYVDNSGFAHHVFAIASIDANGNVKDLRPKGGLSHQSMIAFETQFKLDLTKKFDKVNISGVKGNNNDKVPSLNLFTTEVDKLQSKGDYATKTDLAQGLNTKLNSSVIKQATGNSTTDVISQKGCDELFAKKNSWEKFTAGQIDIRSNGNYTSLTLIKGDGQKLGFETAPGDAYFVYRDAKNNNKAVVTIPSKKDGTLALTSDVEAINNYPVGAPIPWPQATPPNGYFVCDGNNFDKAKYPQLALAYPSGKLPLLYGEFIRGLDLGRKVDPGRTVLSNQGDAMRNITGRIGYARHGGTEPPVVNGEGAFRRDSNHNVNIANGRGDDWGSVMSFNASRVVPTANENRPRNVAFLYIVRAA